MPEVSWETEEFEYYQRGFWWYLVAVVVVGLLLLLAWWFRNWMLGLVVVVALGAIMMVGRVRPRIIQVRVNEKTLSFANRSIELNKVKSFWLTQTSEGFKVNFLLGLRLTPLLTFKIPREKIEPLRELLKDKLPEEDRGEDIIDKLNRFLKI